MSETPYKPNDPAFLLSRSLDEDLSEADRLELEAALASSESLRAQADELRAVDRLVRRWGERPAELDWDSHAALASAQAESDDDEEKLTKVDHLLASWGDRSVLVDAERFTAGVMARLHREHKRRRPYGVIFRIGAPLAAAAAVGFAVTSALWFAPDEPICQVVYGPRVSTATAPYGQRSGARAEAVVAFARTPVGPMEEAPAGISFGTIGSEPLGSPQEVSAPL